MRPCVGRIPNSPQWLPGPPREPPVWEPSAVSQRRFDTAEAEPDEEPPGIRSGAPPFTGVPKCAFLPLSEKASSSVWVLPTKRAPASSSAWTAGAVRVLIPDIARTCGDPAPVGYPATSNRSFAAKVTSARGPEPADGTSTGGYGMKARAGSSFKSIVSPGLRVWLKLDYKMARRHSANPAGAGTGRRSD